MLKFFLWLRYLRKIKLVLLSIGAVAVSTALLAVVASLFTGFIDEFEKSAVRLMGDVVLMAPVKFEGYDSFIKKIDRLDSVKAATPVLKSRGLIHLGRGIVRAVDIWGIEQESRKLVTDFEETIITTGQSEQGEGFLGIGIISEPNSVSDEYDFDEAKKIIGSDVVLTTGTVVESEQDQKHFKRKLVKFKVGGIVFSGIYGIDETVVYLPIDSLKEILYPQLTGKVASEIQIKLKDGSDVESSLAQIQRQWRDFAANELGWSSYLISYTDIDTSIRLQSRFVAELQKQMGMLLLIFGVVSLGAVFLVFCIFYMIVVTRLKDIAIIKSCGGTSFSVAGIFLGFGCFVGLLGAVTGILAGYVVTVNINVIEEWIRVVSGIKLWKSSIYMFSEIPNQMNWQLGWLIVVSAVFAAVVGSLIPAIAAARCRPVELLRYE
jgi:lipoprotein-releasing system permease protein